MMLDRAACMIKNAAAMTCRRRRPQRIIEAGQDQITVREFAQDRYPGRA